MRIVAALALALIVIGAFLYFRPRDPEEQTRPVHSRTVAEIRDEEEIPAVETPSGEEAREAGEEEAPAPAEPPPGSGTIRGEVIGASSPVEVALHVIELAPGIAAAGGIAIADLLDARPDDPGLKKKHRKALREVARTKIQRGETFEFSGLGAAVYLVSANAAGMRSPSELIHLAKDETKSVAIHLESGLAIEGIVRSADGESIPDAEVRFWAMIDAPERGEDAAFVKLGDLLSIYLNPLARSVRTDTEGRFRAMGLHAVPYAVRALADDWAPALLITDPYLGEELEFTLHPAARVNVTVLSAAGDPIEGAEVEVRRPPELPPQFAGPDEPPKRGKTDASGLVRIGGLGSSEYALSARRSGYVRVEAQRLDLEAEVEHAVTLRLEEAAIIEGRVVDRDGSPVPLASIDSHRGAAARARSDEDGRFRLDELSAGEYTLSCSKNGFTTQRRAVTAPASGVEIVLGRGEVLRGRVLSAEDDSAIDKAHVRLIRDGERLDRTTSNVRGEFHLAGVDPGAFELEVRAEGYMALRAPFGAAPAGEIVLALVRAPKLRGIVRTPSGAPLAGAEVTGQCADPEERRITVSSGADGSFACDLPSAHAEWYFAAVANRFLESESVAVSAGAHPPEIELVLRAGITVEGHVVGPRAERIAGARLTFSERRRSIGRAGGKPRLQRIEVVSDARGEFKREGLAPGKFQLEVTAPGYGARREEELSIDEGMEALSIELAVERRIEGTVATEAGNPIAAARVTARGRESGKRIRSDTNDGGIFELSGLAGEPFDLRVEAAGYASWRRIKMLAGDERIAVVLEAERSLTGEAFDLSTGEPVAGAKIAVTQLLDPEAPSEDGSQREAIRQTCDTRSDGRFELGGLPRGRYDLSCRAIGYEKFERRGEAAVSAGDELRIELVRGCYLEGTIVDEAGNPVRGAKIKIGGEEAQSDPGGEFTFAFLPSGVHSLRISHDEYVPLLVTDLEARAGGNESRRFVMASGATLEGQVFGAPADAIVELQSSDASIEKITRRLSAEGRYRIAGLPGGEYELRYKPSAKAKPSATAAVSIPPRGRIIKDLEP